MIQMKTIPPACKDAGKSGGERSIETTRKTQRETNPFPYSDDNKRYHTWNYFLRTFFGGKTVKIPLSGNFTCPNRDGAKGFGGCIYCLNGSGSFAGNPAESIQKQFASIQKKMQKKWGDTGRYLAYFQTGSGTYAPLEKLRTLYEEALRQPGVKGLSIATRPDCISPDVLDYLETLSYRTFLTIELGLQSVHDRTGIRINRQHTYQDFLNCYQALAARNIRVCIHLINGLPGEDRNMMMETVRRISELSPFSVKLHLLHILRETPLGEEYLLMQSAPQKAAASDLHILSLEEYVSLICDQLELLPPETVVQRITGDGPPDSLLAPLWSLKKFAVMDEIDKELFRRNSWQGKYIHTKTQQSFDERSR